MAPVLLLTLLLVQAMRFLLHKPSPLPPIPPLQSEFMSPLAAWPWPTATQETPHSGVTHWYDTSSPDGTTLDLFDFDFGSHPNFRLEIYDQDEDDALPFDNRAGYWKRGVGQITTHLNKTGRGKVLAAWNGLFFDYDYIADSAIASHLTPVVLNGKLHYPAAGSHRWTFGAQYRNGKSEFKTLHLPDRRFLAQEFDFAAGAAQCLVREGQPLLLQPFPRPGEVPRKRPIRTTPQEAGHIPDVDFIKTSRASLGWSQDSRHLYLLFVSTHRPELESALHLHHQEPMQGGWSVHELQQFWMAKKAWGAINSDGGDPAQMTFLRPDGNYLLAPPRWSGVYDRKIYTPDFPNAPGGGTLMYFIIRERKR